MGTLLAHDPDSRGPFRTVMAALGRAISHSMLPAGCSWTCPLPGSIAALAWGSASAKCWWRRMADPLLSHRRLGRGPLSLSRSLWNLPSRTAYVVMAGCPMMGACCPSQRKVCADARIRLPGSSCLTAQGMSQADSLLLQPQGHVCAACMGSTNDCLRLHTASCPGSRQACCTPPECSCRLPQQSILAAGQP